MPVLLPANSVATSTPQGTPSMVPSSRCQPLVRVSPQELVPAKITNAAITAQNQRDGDTNSPIDDGQRRGDGHLDGLPGGLPQAAAPLLVGGVVGGRGDAVGLPVRSARPAAAPSTSARTSAVAVAALIIARARRRTAAVARVIVRGGAWLLVKNPLGLARGLLKPAFLRYADGPRELGERRDQFGAGGGRISRGMLEASAPLVGPRWRPIRWRARRRTARGPVVRAVTPRPAAWRGRLCLRSGLAPSGRSR